MVRAAVLRAPSRPLEIEEITVASPGPGEVQVKVEACAICHSDIMFFDGAWDGPVPAVYGHEAAGEVTALGDGVDNVAVGDRVVISLIRSCGRCPQCDAGLHVACTGSFAIDERTPLRSADGSPLHHGLGTAAFAEVAVVDASQVAVVPAAMPLTSAALLGCGVITGVGAVTNTAAVEAGCHVVVVGCGGVGLNTLQGAALAGATTVVAVDLDAEKRAGAGDFGATHAVDPRDADAVEQIERATNGHGADYVFVTVGAKAALEQAFSFVGAGGALVIVGMTADGVTVEFDSTTVANLNQRVLGSKMGSGRLAIDIPWLVEQYESGRLHLDELVTGVYPLEEINAAIAEVKAGAARRNVIVFTGPADEEST